MYMSVSACFVCYLENNKTGNEKCCSAPSNQVTHKDEKSDEEDTTNKQTKKKATAVAKISHTTSYIRTHTHTHT